jgi:hypothetical protein
VNLNQLSSAGCTLSSSDLAGTEVQTSTVMSLPVLNVSISYDEEKGK